MRNRSTKHQFYYKYQETTVYWCAQHPPGVRLKETDLPCVFQIFLFVVWVLATATLAPNPVTQVS